MFKILKLILINETEEYTYEFSEGLNYFKGTNGSGKTEFYGFIDYMFGSSEKVEKKPWFKESLSKAIMQFEYKNTSYSVARTLKSDENYFGYLGEENDEILILSEYRNRLDMVFREENFIKELRKFTKENLTFRSFTLFNFLGEKRQGLIQDFFDKANQIRYSVKMKVILNFIFNSNINKIFELQSNLEILEKQIYELEKQGSTEEFLKRQVNSNLQKINSSILYDGKNKAKVLEYIQKLVDMSEVETKKSKYNISELTVMYNSISEQIKKYDNEVSDIKKIKNDNENRKKLLFQLQDLIKERDEFKYLVEPIEELLKDSDNSISFSDYLISDKTVNELRKMKRQLKEEIKRNDSRFKIYSIDEKSKSIAAIEDYLSIENSLNLEELTDLKKRAQALRKEIKKLQNSDDIEKIKKLSKNITKLYYSAKDVSSIVKKDFELDDFSIKYIKNGNILQPIISSEEKQNNGEENLYTGSMARHTLIQLCGYLAFLDLMIQEEKYPLIPIFVVDHISKQFDEMNIEAIGKVFSAAYELIGKKKFQVFMFDDETFEKLSIIPDHEENLVTEVKTGFNPFYFSSDTEDK